MKEVLPWPTLAEGPVADHRVLGVQTVRRRNPRNGVERDYVVLRAAPWVNVIALTPQREVVLVRQFRHGVGEVTLEVPGGIVDPGEEPAAAAGRELLEETGYAGGPPILLGRTDPNPALFDNRCYSLLIEDARPVAEPTPDEGEDIAVLTAPLAEIPALLAGGHIGHTLVVTAFAHLTLAGRFPELCR